MSDPAGELIDGRYRLIRKIGSGGMATVFLAEDERLGRRVAVKRLGVGSPEDASRRLVQEARLGAGLNHPNIVTVYDALPDPGGETVLIVMELVDGTDLSRDLAEGRPDDRTALALLDDVGSALDHIHQHGIVHRDVKPSNVLLARAGRAKLTDLGIAKALEDTGITRSGVVLGSVPYMSPEQLSGKPAGPASDIYSLALIAFEVLSGRRAHAGENPLRVTHEAIHEAPPSLREARPDLPEATAGVIARALDPDPDRRPVSACSFVRELEESLAAKASPSPVDRVHSETLASRPVPAPEPTAVDRRRLWPFALAGLAVAGVVAAILLASGGSEGGAPGAGEGQRTQAAADQPSGGAEGGANGGSAAAAGVRGDPAAAVEAFYTGAAAGDFESAFAAATPNLEAQLGGTAQFESLESIEFERLEAGPQSAGSASVSFSTVATHSDRVEECTGSATVVASGGSWLLDSIDAVDCTPA
jgi:eukaryotic-like serine/threonine-protein kinase